MNRKLVAWMMASCMTLSMAAPAFAENEGAEGGPTVEAAGSGDNIPEAPNQDGETTQTPGNSGDDTSQTPDSPGGDTTQAPGTPGDDTTQTPDSDATQTPGTPDENINETPENPGGDATQTPGTTDGETTQAPGKPDGDTPAESAADTAARLINALPTVESITGFEPVLEIAQDAPGYNDAYQAAIQAHLDQVKNQVAEARAAYDKLTDAEKGAFDATTLGKLTDLETALENLAQATTLANVTKDNLATKLNAGGKVTLDSDITLDSALTIASTTTATLDLSTHTLTCTTLVVEGNLTLKADSNGKITSSTGNMLAVKPGGTLTIENGEYKTTGGDCVYNQGTFTLKDGTLKSSDTRHGILNEAASDATKKIVCNIEGGSISGGYWGIGLLNKTSAHSNDMITLNIRNGRITATNQAGPPQGISCNNNMPGFTVNMSGGEITVSGTNSCGMYLPGKGVTTISGGTIHGATQGIRIVNGALNVRGGTITNNEARNDKELVGGDSGGTAGAIVIGKPKTDYKYSIAVDITGGTIQNKATGTKDAIVVSDKNMGSLTGSSIAVNVSGSATVEGNVYTTSTVSGAAATDGGSTKISLNGVKVNGDVEIKGNSPVSASGATITGDVINNGGDNAKTTINSTTVKGSVKNDSKGGITGTGNYVTGNVENTSTSGGNVSLTETTVSGTVSGNATITKPTNRPSTNPNTNTNTGSSGSSGGGGGSSSSNKGASMFSKLTDTINGILKGSLSGATGAAGKTDTTATTGAPVTQAAATKAAASAISQAQAQGKDSADVRFYDATAISAGVLESIASQAQKAGLEAQIVADTMSGGAVAGRISLPASAAARLGKDLNLSVKIGNTAVEKHFAKYYRSRIAVLEMGQRGSYGVPVSVAAKIDLKGMDAKNLHFYSYDAATNTFHEILQSNYFVDKNGYVHFTTSVGDCIVISDGALTQK